MWLDTGRFYLNSIGAAATSHYMHGSCQHTCCQQFKKIELVNLKLWSSTIGMSPDHLNPTKQMSVLSVDGQWPRE